MGVVLAQRVQLLAPISPCGDPVLQTLNARWLSPMRTRLVSLPAMRPPRQLSDPRVVSRYSQSSTHRPGTCDENGRDHLSAGCRQARGALPCSKANPVNQAACPGAALKESGCGFRRMTRSAASPRRQRGS